MAASLFYIGLPIAVEAWPVQMHFQQRYGRADAWDWTWIACCGAGLIVVNLTAFALPWVMGRRNLEAYEEK